MSRPQFFSALSLSCLLLGVAVIACLILHAVRDVPSETQRRLAELQNDTATRKEACLQMREFLRSPLCMDKGSRP